MLINNSDVTRRFLSLRAGPICTATAAYELMNHRHRRTVFFLDWWKSYRIFFPFLPFLQRRSAFSTVVLPEKIRICLAPAHIHAHAHTPTHIHVQTHLCVVRISSPSPTVSSSVYILRLPHHLQSWLSLRWSEYGIRFSENAGTAFMDLAIRKIKRLSSVISRPIFSFAFCTNMILICIVNNIL